MRQILFLLFLPFVAGAAWAGAAAPGGDETVRINGIEYPVPPPWAGHRFDAPSWLPVPPLVMVPRDLVVNRGEIYLLPEARDALTAMAAQAARDGIELRIDSGYRSAAYQRKVYIRLMEEKNKSFAEAARYVAPPGYSEHMLGLAVDFAPSDWRFVKTPAYGWLKQHAAAFGFRETYPESRPNHQPWEPSHWRYIGTP
jgi:D-alanyl-D-alanine carboxypeptidase